MAFHPRYFANGVKNSSRIYNYARWNAESRQTAAQHIRTDTRPQPHAEEPLELVPDIRLVPPPGGLILFSGQQLHSTVENTSNRTRFSIDFRTVHVGDVRGRRGAPNARLGVHGHDAARLPPLHGPRAHPGRARRDVRHAGQPPGRGSGRHEPALTA
jgi:hypothetical protein